MPRRYTKQDLRILAESGLGAALPAPKPPRKNEETRMQMELVGWWAGACFGFGVPEFLLWHTPNGSVYAGSADNRARIGAMMKRQGCREGVPDLFLAFPKWGDDGLPGGWDGIKLAGLFVEMKAPNGVVSAAQKIMLKELENQGYQCAVCWTVEDAKEVITNYLTK